MLYYVLICNLAHAQLYASSCVYSTILLYEQLLSLDIIPNLQAIYSGVLKVKKHFSDGAIITQSYTPTS